MRIWVARPEPGAARTGERLAALGHRPLVAPVLVVRPTGAALPDGPFDGLILTSAQALAALGRAECEALGGVAVFAVGQRTAVLARRAGLGPVHDAGGNAGDLGALVLGLLPKGAQLLRVTGRDRKAEPAATLDAAGYRLATHVAYEAQALAVLPASVAEALAADRLEAALHYSRRSAATALQLAIDADRIGSFRALKHYCLSDDVAGPLEAAGVPVHFVATCPREDDILAGLS